MKRLLIILFVFTTGVVNAQQETDSVRLLSEVKVQDKRLKTYATGNKLIQINPEVIKNQSYSSFTDLLTRNTSVNIRSYGVSGLSTISFRGSGSNHSAILWEGINLQSPSNGSLDLTLLPVSFVDNVTLQFGGGSTLFGSGALGGAIHIAGSQPEFDNRSTKISLSQQLGSFGNQYTGVNLKYSGKDYEVKLRVFTKKADNDFSFDNRFTLQREKQENADLKQSGVMLEVAYRLKDNHTVQAKYWLQDNLINISKVASAGAPSFATQADYFHRGLILWEMDKGKDAFNMKSAFVLHELIYDNKVNILSNSLTKAWTNEASWDHQFSKYWQLQTGVNHTYESGESDGYGTLIPDRHRTALFTALKGLINNKLETTLALREAYNVGQWSPFLPSLGLHYQPDPKYGIKGKIARSYRIPTFNDLYWATGGNPILLPEKGVNIELGSEQIYELGKVELQNELTIFSNYIHNWIQWIPGSVGIWSPNNVQEVWSRGVEATSQALISLNSESLLRLNGSYQHTNTTKEKTKTQAGQNELGKQLIYVPYHQGNLSLLWNKKLSTIGTKINYTGSQFTTGDNDSKRALDQYTIIDISASQNFSIRNEHSLMIGMEIKNLGNKSYEVRANYPMPGRSFNVNINYQFN